MTFLIKMMESKAMMWFCGAMGDALVIVGIVFAALNTSVAGFSPIVWILLGMVFYVYFVISMLAKIFAGVSKK
jgi:hypothetical protein